MAETLRRARGSRGGNLLLQILLIEFRFRCWPRPPPERTCKGATPAFSGASSKKEKFETRGVERGAFLLLRCFPGGGGRIRRLHACRQEGLWVPKPFLGSQVRSREMRFLRISGESGGHKDVIMSGEQSEQHGGIPQDVEEGEVHIPGRHFEPPFRTECSQEYSMLPSKKTKSAGVRGASWKENEILELLSIWGEAKVQEALRASHRNFDSYKGIAREMVARGYNRTAEECRSKTKTLRKEYRWVIAHNSQPGNDPVTCPFYSELHRILRGDASVKPRRLVRSVKCKAPRRSAAVPPQQLQEGSEKLSTHEILGDICDPSTGRTEEGASVESGDREDEDATQIENFPEGLQGEDPPGEGPSGRQGGTPAQNVGEDSEGDGPPSPNTRLAKSRTKRKRVPALYTATDRMMAHTAQLLDRELEARGREHEMEMEKRRRERVEDEERWEREQEARERMIAESQQDRQLIHEALKRNLAMMESAMEAVRMLVALQQPPSTSGTGVG